MSTQLTQWILQLTDKVSGPLGVITGAAGKAQTALNSVGGVLQRMGTQAQAVNHLGMAMQNAGQSIQNLMTPAIDLDTAMHRVQMITGVAGEELAGLNARAKALSLTFGGPASAQAELFTAVLSDLGPQVARDQAALGQMTETINRLGLTMGGDTLGATRALTGMVNVFGQASWTSAQQADFAARAANVLAAASREGNVEVGDMAASLKESAGAAKSAGIGVEELGALLQTLGKLNIRGSEAGTGLRNVLTLMNAPELLDGKAIAALARYGVNLNVVKNAALPLGARLQELAKIQGDAGAMAMVFGRENLSVGQQLLQNIPLYSQYRTAIYGTNTLLEQSNVMLDSMAERMARARAQIDRFKIGIVESTGAFGPYLAVFSEWLPALGMALPALVAVKVAVIGLSKWVTRLGVQMLVMARTAITTMLAGLRALPAAILRGSLSLRGLSFSLAGVRTAMLGVASAGKALLASNPFGWLILGISLIVEFRDEINNALEAAVNLVGITTDRQDRATLANRRKQQTKAATDLNATPEQRAAARRAILNEQGEGGISVDPAAARTLANSTRRAMEALTQAQRTGAAKLNAEQLKQLKQIANTDTFAKSSRDLAAKLLRDRNALDSQRQARQLPAAPGGAAASGGLSAGIAGVAANGGNPVRNINVTIGSLIDRQYVDLDTPTDAANLKRNMANLLIDAIRDAENAAAA